MLTGSKGIQAICETLILDAQLRENSLWRLILWFSLQGTILWKCMLH